MGFRKTIAEWLLQSLTESDQNSEIKQQPPSVTLSGVTPTGSPVSFSPRNTRNFAQFGYLNNTTTFRAVNIVAQACASVDWKVYKSSSFAPPNPTTGKVHRVALNDHPLARLLSRPNKDKARSSFIAQLISYWLIAGSNYMLASFDSDTMTPGQAPLGLYNLRPDLVTQIAGEDGSVAAYRYDLGDNKFIEYPSWKVLPIRFFHPLDELAGLSVIQVAAAVIERQNAGEEWNFHLMRNMARPSGAFVAQTEFSDEGRARMRREVQNKYGRGKLTAGMPMLLENGLSYIQLAINPVDADWYNSDASAGRKIASAIGVDPLLLNDKQYATYNNELEAKLAMWELTCFPLMEMLKDEMNGFLVPFYGGNVEIDYDREPIESLKRNRQLESVTTIAEWNTGIRSYNASASEFALPPVPNKDDFLRLGPTFFVRVSEIGDFLDAQRNIWNPPLQQSGGFGNRPGLPKPPTDIGNPSAGSIVANKVPTNVIPITPVQRQFRESWTESVVKGLMGYAEEERQLLTHALTSSKGNVKQAVTSTYTLHTSQLMQMMAQYYASIAMDAGNQVSQDFGEKFLLSAEVIAALGEHAGLHLLDLTHAWEEDIKAILQQNTALPDKIREMYAKNRGVLHDFAAQQVILAQNTGRYFAAKQVPLPLLKTWISVDRCHEGLDGVTLPLAQAYPVVNVMYPQCVCTESYSLDFSVHNPFVKQTTVA